MFKKQTKKRHSLGNLKWLVRSNLIDQLHNFSSCYTCIQWQSVFIAPLVRRNQSAFIIYLTSHHHLIHLSHSILTFHYSYRDLLFNRILTDIFKIHECYFCLYIKSERIHTTLLKSHYYPNNPWGTDVDDRGLLKEEFVKLHLFQ